MAADVGTDADTIRRFFAAAGVAQYTDKLIDEGFDSLSTLLTIDETGLQDLKAAAGMKPGHLAALRAKIGNRREPAARWKSRRVQKDPSGVLDATARAAAEHARKAAQHAVDAADREARLAARRGGS